MKEFVHLSCGIAVVIGALAANSAVADHISVGLGLNDGSGNALSIGINTRRPPVPPPAPVIVAPAPVVVAPAPVIVAQPAPVVVAQPAQVVVAQPAVVVAQPAGGYWVDVDNRVWVEGAWVEVTDAWGHHSRQRGPGHWENHHDRQWRTGPGPGPGGDRHDHYDHHR